MKKLLFLLSLLALPHAFAAQQSVVVTGGGESLTSAFTKINSNFDEIYQGDLSAIYFTNFNLSSPGANEFLMYDGDEWINASIFGTQVAFADSDSNFTATTISAAIEELDNVNGSGPNAADGKVDWSQLTNVPAGFADGTDATGAGGSAIVLDLGDDGGDDSVDLSEIAITGDTNGIFTESAADKLLIAAGNNWPTADTANAGDNATAFFPAGTIEHERGGLESDVSAYNGLVRIASGSTSAVTNLAGLNTALGSSIADGAHTTSLDALTFDVGSVSKIEYGYLDGVTSAIQTQLDGKQASGSYLEAGDNIGAATATTPSANDNDTSVATTAYVQTELTAERVESRTFTIAEPDIQQGISDDWLLMKFPAEKYPSGVTITSIHIDVSAAYTSETFLFEHWDDAAGTTQATVESITSTAISVEDDGTLSDATIPADYFLMVNLDDTPEDKAYVAITVTFTY